MSLRVMTKGNKPPPLFCFRGVQLCSYSSRSNRPDKAGICKNWAECLLSCLKHEFGGLPAATALGGLVAHAQQHVEHLSSGRDGLVQRPGHTDAQGAEQAGTHI